MYFLIESSFLPIQIQTLKQQLAGYSEFDARTAFCCIDNNLKGYIDVSNLRSLTNRLSAEYRGLSSLSSTQFQWFLRKYGSQNKMSYEQFLLLLLPKNNPSLAQTLMVRNPNNLKLPEYLKQRFESLIGYYIIMILQTQERKQVLYKYFRLNILDLYNNLHRIINNQNGLWGFINNNGYEIKRTIVKYLVNHTSSKLPLKDFHENQYRQIFSPIDSLSFASIEPLSIQRRANYSPQARLQIQRQRSPCHAKRSFADSFYEKPKDNYLTMRFDTIKHASFTNRTHYSSNENIQANLLPVIQQICSTQTIPPNRNERLNFSPIVKQSIKQFESIDLPGAIDNFVTNKNIKDISLGTHQFIPQIPTRQAHNRIGQLISQNFSSNNIIPHPQTNTFIIDKFLKQNNSPIKSYKPQKQIFEDDLEESVNNAIKYY